MEGSINDMVKNTGVPENEFDNVNSMPDMNIEVEQKQGFNLDLGFLKSPTGAGSIDDYIEHPMNFFRSRGLGQVLRGLTGLVGSLDLAIIDVVLGAMQFLKERKGLAANG